MECVLTEIELNGVEKDLFDIYFDKDTNRYTAKEIGGTRELVYQLNGNVDEIAKEHREEILVYRLGRFTDEDIVDVGDIFMIGKFTNLI
jgi:hypothetical protein